MQIQSLADAIIVYTYILTIIAYNLRNHTFSEEIFSKIDFIFHDKTLIKIISIFFHFYNSLETAVVSSYIY